MIVCTYEDRIQNEPALQVLVQSLTDRNPGIKIFIFCPNPSEYLIHWLKNFPHVVLDNLKINASGWNIKPTLLLHLIELHDCPVAWIDADILVRGSLSTFFPENGSGTLVVAEEALWGKDRDDHEGKRARGWGFPLGRTLPHVLNSCFVIVNKNHSELLRRWKFLLEDPNYVDAQMHSFDKRPAHLAGDQDVLTALLSSAEFCAVPLRIVKRGGEILQLFGPFGFTLKERIVAILFEGPVLIHSQGSKPWLRADAKNYSRHHVMNLLIKLNNECSPYRVLAGELNLEYKKDAGWFMPKSNSAKIITSMGFGKYQIVGLPLAAILDLIRALKFIIKCLSFIRVRRS